MALRLKEAEPNCNYEFCITPTGRELPTMDEHWSKLECLLGQPLIRVPAPTLVDLIIKQKCLPNWRMRWCTRLIKIEPFIHYAQSQAPAICHVGIRSDEVVGNDVREGTDWNGIEGISQDLPLVRWGWGINKVKTYLQERGVSIPQRTDCDMCFFQRLEEWWRLWKDYPQRWAEAEALENYTGHTLRSDGRDSWPASLIELRKKFESGLTPRGAAQTEFAMESSDRKTMCAWCSR